MTMELDFISFYLGWSPRARLKWEFVEEHGLANVWERAYVDEG